MCSKPNSRATAPADNVSWLDAIPDGPFRFRLGTRPADAAAFFAATDANHEILAERRHWLQSDPQRYATLLPDGVAVLDTVIKLRASWPAGNDAGIDSLWADAAPWEKCLALGMAWEPDFALMRLDASGRMVLVGGCVCFPTNWRLADKIGQTIGIVHDVVPGLTASIGAPIDNFLSRMKPGVCWMRSNWGAAASCQRNQHSDLGLPVLTADSELEEVWLRIEDQALVPLPEVGGLLFGIRLRHVPFRDLLRNPVACRRLRTAVATMSREMLEHKHLAGIRDRMLTWLDATS